jgi:hypothetical protein
MDIMALVLLVCVYRSWRAWELEYIQPYKPVSYIFACRAYNQTVTYAYVCILSGVGVNYDYDYKEPNYFIYIW